MISTTYTCDRCGHTQDSWEREGEESRQMWNVAIVASYEQAFVGVESRTSRRAHWCDSCARAAGILPPLCNAPDPPPPLSLEDLVREIVRGAREVWDSVNRVYQDERRRTSESEKS